MFFRILNLLVNSCSVSSVDKTRRSRGSELRPIHLGTWGIGSQWCNRLLWIVAILKRRFFVWGKGKREGKGGDGARLAFEEIGKARGRTLVLAYDRPIQACPAPANRHSTALRGWGKYILVCT